MYIQKLFMLLSADGDMVWRQALQWMKWIIYSHPFSLMCLDKNMEVKSFRALQHRWKNNSAQGAEVWLCIW